MNRELNISKNTDWDDYAQSFAVITSEFQAKVYSDIADKLYGDVGDFGAGTAKILPYLKNKSSVNSYTGIDASPVMVEIGQALIEQHKFRKCKMVLSSIESLKNMHFHSAVSINSYYAWNNHENILNIISECLTPGADFYLVNPNHKLDMPLLLERTKREHLMNPFYNAFAESNLKFDKNLSKNFVDIDYMINQVRNSGFAVISCHQDYFLGGVNYLHLKKTSA